MTSHLSSQRPAEFYRQLPKVELHRHLEGSLRISTMTEIARLHGFDAPETAHLRPLVQVHHEEPFTFENFLSKFATLRKFYRSPKIIQRITREAIADAAIDNVRYLELRFTPVALSRAEDYPLAEVMDWVIEATNQARRDYDITVRLIASVNRHESLKLAEEVAALAIERRNAGIVGLDLAGNEANFSAQPFAPIFQEARQDGLKTTIHAGEWAGAKNVAEAIELFEADRVGHGVRVLEDPNVVAMARERATIFEVCVTSNYQSGVVPALSDHPLPRMLFADLNVTINTDDPSVSNITLSDEYKLICEDLGIPIDILQERVLAAVNGAFLPDAQRKRLAENLADEFSLN